MKIQFKTSFVRLIILSLLCLTILVLDSCQKEFLEKKPDRSRLVPKTVADFQALSDSEVWYSGPGIQEISNDDYIISDIGLLATSAMSQNIYKWLPNSLAGETIVQDWSIPHTQIFYANIILEGLEGIADDERNSPAYNSVKGTAFFQRAFAYYNLAQVFSAPYDPNTSNQLPGIPLRLVSDVNARYPRGTVKQTYDQIIKDLQTALPYLPDEVNYRNRPSKVAVYALLARVYLSMSDYVNAELNANMAVQIKHDLIDYSTIKGNATDRIMPSALRNANVEVIFYKGALTYAFPNTSALANVVPPLYNSYVNDDLRKVLFFRSRGNGLFTFRGTYGGIANVGLFTGLATDEMYLILAECKARRGELTGALNDLNKLLITRFIPGKFVNYTGTDRESVLRIILMERRKELISRGLRWTDLRRLNLDPLFATELIRTVAEVQYKLVPNSNRYTFPLPDDAILIGGLTQNP